MSLEQKINYHLNKFPAVKKVIKRAYQLGMYAISPKIKSEGNIECVSPDDGKEYFFGYYDKSPWDATQRYMLCMRANNTWSDVSPKEPADIILIDTTKAKDEDGRVRKLAETRAWNIQMSCMLQWLGPDYQSKILYNDFRDGRFCAVILNVESGEERVLSMTVAYTELDDFSRQALMTKTMLLNVYTDPMYDTLSELQGESLLLLGNSFIGSSQIGSILNDMMQQNGKSCNATAISRGYARVSTYTSDASMMNRIRNGEWGAVFICGFYDDETKCLGLLKDACDASGTKLIIFPAHNENSGVIEKNRNTYPTLPCLNWKSEIEALIDEGRSQWDFCVDDQHLHSTPLAGYVGAMMIYRSIYGQMPTARMYSIDQAAYDDVLGAYMDDPSMQLMNTKSIIPVG